MRTATQPVGVLTTTVYEAVFDAVALTPRSRLLDVVCGSGAALAVAANRGSDVAGIDDNERVVRLARRMLRGADIRLGTVAHIPFEDDSFDIVTSFNRIATIDQSALQEVRRVTRRGGRVAVATDRQADDARLLAAGFVPRPQGAVTGFIIADLPV